MRLYCFRYPRNTVTDILICFLCIFIILLVLINADYKKDLYCDAADDAVSSFLENNGWLTDAASLSISEKKIPEVFDETYREYSLLQKKQGFDIEKYKGKTVRHISYRLLNFPGFEDNNNIYINFLIFNNEIIGADILCTNLNGFITGAVRHGNNQT